MDDILIRGMEMPKTCSDCVLCYDYMMCRLLEIGFYDYGESFGCCEERLKDCPLVELPKHGDLIDRDWLKKVAYSKVNDFGGAFVDTLDLAIAPVIIPANKEAEQ